LPIQSTFFLLNEGDEVNKKEGEVVVSLTALPARFSQ
jgi:hypothetical protein